MKTRNSLLIAAGLLGLATSLNAQTGIKRKFIDPANMDLSVKPGDDFYRYASGTWLKNNPVPAKETRWGSFQLLRDSTINAVHGILNEAAANKTAPKGSVEQRVGDFYAAAMDSLAIEKLGYSPVKADLARLNAVKSLADVWNETAVLNTSGMASPFFSFYIYIDSKDVNKMVPQLGQGGTSLPDRDYYLKNDARTLKIQDAYKNYVTKLFTLTGTQPALAKKHADAIFRFEKELAGFQMSRVERRDPNKTYNKYTLRELNKLTPGINWPSMFGKLKIQGQDTVLVSSPKFMAEMSNLVARTPVNVLKTYLQWNVLKSSALYLSSPFVKASFEYSQVLSGQKVQTPRWQRMSSLTDNSIGELLGQLYVKKYFKPEAKERMNELIANLKKAYEIRIKKLDWMSDATKEKALAKLHAFDPKIGYPDTWKTYDGLEISRDAFFQNIRNTNAWEYNEMIAQLGKPVDRKVWGMTPPTVNAYYNPVKNEIVFPAGILQFPFFDANADDAINYGGIGSVIGHEMSHGFDDQGSQYAADGNLKDWWTAEDKAKFKAKTKTLVDQFNAYTVLDTIHVNGEFTLGENIGDLGGLNAAYEAFKMTKQGQSNEKIDGLTPDQRFFLSWAQVWRGNTLPETTSQLIVTDPHSPGEYRTIGAPVNMDAWYEAFNVKPGDKLYKKPEERIKIW